MKNCCFKNIHQAIRIGRASYICPKYKGDVSLAWYFYQTALMQEVEASVRLATKRKKKK